MEKNGNPKIVLLLAHPDRQESKANKALVNVVKDLPQVNMIRQDVPPLGGPTPDLISAF